MDKRRLVLGLAVLLMVVGGVLACFTPGGLFNSSYEKSLETPFGSVTVTGQKKSSEWPIVGYVLLGAGALGLVLAFAMKSPPRS